MYYLIEPLCHGNGGWHGHKIIARGNVEKLKKIGEKYCDYNGGWEEKWDNEVRICKTKEVNDSVWILDVEKWKWVEGNSRGWRKNHVWDNKKKEWVRCKPVVKNLNSLKMRFANHVAKCDECYVWRLCGEAARLFNEMKGNTDAYG